MRRFLLLLAMALVVAAFAAPASASPGPCVLNCYDIQQTTNTSIQ